MGWKSQREASGPSVWELAERQHGVVARSQLLDRGLSRRSIERRLTAGRLHPVLRGVYAVGRPGITRRGHWMAAVLCCDPNAADTHDSPGAVLSHGSAAALWGIAPDFRAEGQRARAEDQRVGGGGASRAGAAPRRAPRPVQVSVRRSNGLDRQGVEVHRRPSLEDRDLAVRDGIPVTGVVQTLIDLATLVGDSRLERAVNEADRLDLIDPGSLRAALGDRNGRPGVRRLRALLDRRTFRLTASELERRFLGIVRDAAMPPPLTGQAVSGFEVDFYWPGLGLVVETDGLRYHRTPGQQARDRVRDQAHTSAGLTPLRFTHAQVNFEPDWVKEVLAGTATRLAGSRVARTGG